MMMDTILKPLLICVMLSRVVFASESYILINEQHLENSYELEICFLIVWLVVILLANSYLRKRESQLTGEVEEWDVRLFFLSLLSLVVLGIYQLAA